MWWLFGGLPHMSRMLGCISSSGRRASASAGCESLSNLALTVPVLACEKQHPAHRKRHRLHLAWSYGLRLRTGKEAD